MLKVQNLRGLTADSRQVQPGYLFAALPGRVHDGRLYIEEAVARGASAILARPGTQISSQNIQFLIDKNPRKKFAQIAASFYKKQPKKIISVTGTNGKTSVVSFVRHLLAQLGISSGSIGTLGVQAPGMTFPSSLTTPDPVVLHAILADFSERGIEHVALEASSHGLDQYRLDGVHLAAAAFTNLTRDHLDYHGTMSAYLCTKLRLFSDLLPKGAPAVLNADDPAFTIFRKAAVNRGARVWSYGLMGQDLRLLAISSTESGQMLELYVQEQRFKVPFPLVGSFQVMNALCALGLVVAMGWPVSAATAALATLPFIPGRLQWAATHRHGAPIYVDYAHTPAALETVLTALRLQTKNKLIVVFGCGGDRDKGKRTQMGSIAARLADVVIITDDNPRSETPATIRADICVGCPGAYNIGNRSVAIKFAVSLLQPDDILLIAGKGHEKEQIMQNGRVQLCDDVEICRHAVALAKTSSENMGEGG